MVGRSVAVAFAGSSAGAASTRLLKHFIEDRYLVAERWSACVTESWAVGGAGYGIASGADEFFSKRTTAVLDSLLYGDEPLPP